MNSTLVIVPTYNEAGNISKLLKLLFALNLDVLIVDDGSKDGTIEIAESVATNGAKLNFLLRNEKLGLGNAYRAGYAWALEQGYERIIQMDADGSHQVSDLESMLTYSDENPEAELIIGSRWIKDGAIENWSKRREALSRIANKYTQALMNLGVNDATAGFRIYKAELIQRMHVQEIKSEGYCFQIEMTKAAHDNQALIAEYPITFKERESGVSKMSSRIVLEAMARVTYWGLFKNAYHFGLLLLTLFSGFTTFYGLAKSQRSEYYASIAMSMSKNLGNFFFGAIDPAGTVTLDKIPGSYWLPAIFVKLFGFSTWAILAPNALLTIGFVLVVAAIGKRLYGYRAGLIAGAIAATTPIVVAVGRANQPQSAFLFTLALSALWAIKALQSQARRDLVITGLFIALAFHAYMLEAWALWPALIIAWLFTTKSLGQKIIDLLLAGTTSLIASLTWVLVAWFVPASHRPYIGGTYHNNPFEMVFGYNGLGRFSATTKALSSATDDPNFRSFTPPFGGSAGWGRIFSSAVAGQVAWLIPTAALSILLLFWMKKRGATTVFLTLWLVTFFSMFSMVAGIHQFYTSSLSIPVALLISGALTTALERENENISSLLIIAAAISSLFVARYYQNYLRWTSFVQLAFAIAAIVFITLKFKRKAFVTAVSLLALVFAPAAWAFDAHSFTNSINPVAGNVSAMGGFGGPGGQGSRGGFGQPGNGFGNNRPNFPSNGYGNFNRQRPDFNRIPNGAPNGFKFGGQPDQLGQQGGFQDGQRGQRNFAGGFGGGFGQQNVTTAVKYLQKNRNGAKYLLVTFGAQSAASYITATGENVMPIGGFDGQDPTPTLAKFKELVSSGDVRYVLVSGQGGMGGGMMGGQSSNSPISSWVTSNCKADTSAPINSLYLCSKG
jgi:4-amino-4-deoxy-L-arabinose transferase-like glycosyltransferase